MSPTPVDPLNPEFPTRLTELEIQVMHLQRQFEEYNREFFRFQQTILTLSNRIEQLEKDRPDGEVSTHHAPPPHY